MTLVPMVLQVLVRLIPVEMGEHALHRTQATIHVVVLLVSLDCCVKQTLQTVSWTLVIMVGHVWRNMVQQLAVFVLKVLLELSAQHAFLVSFLLQFNASETVLSCDEQSIFLFHMQIHSYPLLAPYRCINQLQSLCSLTPAPTQYIYSRCRCFPSFRLRPQVFIIIALSSVCQNLWCEKTIGIGQLTPKHLG